MDAGYSLQMGDLLARLRWVLLVPVIMALYTAGDFLWRGYTARSVMRKLKAQGIPTIAHSMIFGHLGIMKVFKEEHPSDANILHLQLWLGNNFKRFLPELDEVPPIMYLDLWPYFADPLAIVFNLDMARQLTQTATLPRSFLQKSLFTSLTGNDDLFSMDGQEWKTWRNRFSPAFSIKSITALIPAMIDEVEIFSESLEQMAGGKGEWGPVFQLGPKTDGLTLDVISRALLDDRLHEQTSPRGSPFREGIYETLRLGIKTRARSMSTLDRLLSHKAMAAGRKMLKYHANAMANYIQPLIAHIISPEYEHGQNKTIVRMSWDSYLSEKGADTSAAAKNAFTNTMTNQLKIFLFAGMDTTSTTICWIFKLLQDNPECLAKLRAEHDQVLGAEPSHTAGLLRETPQLLNQLPYTTAVIKETLRLKAPASTQRQGLPGFFLSPRDSDTKYPTEGCFVDEGTHWLQRDDRLWMRPQDFLPHRWLVSKDDPLAPQPHSFRALGIGARSCMGQELAMTEMRLALAVVARKFEIAEAWDKWDKLRGPEHPKPTIDGQRLYPTGIGPAHLKDDMPVHVKLR